MTLVETCPLLLFDQSVHIPSWDFQLGFFPQNSHPETRALKVHEIADHHLGCLLHFGNAIGPTGPMGAARHSPSPPKFEETPALRAIPTNWQKHVHNALSCGLRESFGQWGSHHARVESNSWCRTKQKRTLGSDELIASDGGSENFQTAHGWIQTGVTPSKPLPPGPQLVLWQSTPPCLPAPRPPLLVHLDLSVRPQLRSQNVDNCLDPLRKARKRRPRKRKSF